MTTITRFEPFSAASLHEDVDRLLRETFGRGLGRTLPVDGPTVTAAGAFGPALDASGVRAVQRDGVLTITAPKAEDAKPRRIAVQRG